MGEDMSTLILYSLKTASLVCRCVMLFRTLTISAAAALLAPTIGVVAFHLSNNYGHERPTGASQPSVLQMGPASKLSQAGQARTFSKAALWPSDARALVRKSQAVRQEKAPETAEWQAFVTCLDGQQLSASGRCKPPKTIRDQKTAEALASSKLHFHDGRTPCEIHTAKTYRHPLSQRMTLGGPMSASLKDC
jgi:hypothetical protein